MSWETMKKNYQKRDIAFYLILLVLVLAVLYCAMQILEATVLYTGEEDAEIHESKTIIRGDTAYFPRQDITTVLVLGIDQYGPVTQSESYNNRGAADMDMLLIFDEAAQSCTVLQLNRDTMLEMPVLGIGGRQAGTYYGQLALSHTYGTGLTDSCENTRQTISDFLYGLKIDYYVAMNMDAIAILNDAVGGVTVTVTDDFSQVDPTITRGEVHLMGEHAVSFVRSRQNVGDQLNLSRIQRQKEYIDGFVEAFRRKQEADTEFIVSAYKQVEPYIVTDCSVNAISGMIERYGGYEITEVVTPEGENVLTGEYFEFHVDEEKLDELILRLFYAAK